MRLTHCQKKNAELATRINERSGGKDEFFAQKAEIRGELDELSGKLNELQGKKDEINKAHGDKQQEGRDMRQQLNKMKKSIGYTNASEIDDRIASIEFKLWTESIPLKDEKKLLLEIQELKRNKPKVGKVQSMEANLEQFNQGGSSKETIAAINAEMFSYREAKRKVQERLSELMEGRKAQLGDMPQIISERDEISKQIQEKIRERNTLRDEFRQSEREYNQHLSELRKQKQEKYAEERAQKQKEWELAKLARAADKLDDQPHVAEITLIEQTIFFCKSLTQAKGPAQKEEKKETKVDNPEGTEVLLKKEDRDEFYFAPTKGKKAKAKKGSKTEGSGKPIKHNAETFKLFDSLKLSAPITTDDVPDLLEKLQEQLESYQQKVKVWEEKREEMKRKILEEGIIPGEEQPAEAGDEEETKEEDKADD